MLESKSNVFLNFPFGSQQDLLHPATIGKADDPNYTAEVEEPDPILRPGENIFVYYYLGPKFVKQPARLDAIMPNDPMLVIGFQITGEPMSAESRERFRVSTVMANLTAAVGAEAECLLLDVSTTGFAVEATQRYEIGQVVSATLRYQNRQFTGRARVQSIRQLDMGRVRYGLHAVEDNASGGELRKGQQHISAAIEREQLRRLARGG